MSIRQSLPTIAILVFALIAAFALLGLVRHATEVDARGEHAANLDGGIDLHDRDKYALKIKKVKPRNAFSSKPDSCQGLGRS